MLFDTSGVPSITLDRAFGDISNIGRGSGPGLEAFLTGLESIIYRYISIDEESPRERHQC